MKRSKPQSIFAFLNRNGLLTRVLGEDGDPRRRTYANTLILKSEALLAEQLELQPFASLRDFAERQFANNTNSWVHTLVSDSRERSADWERVRAEELGYCFATFFEEIREGLPLHVRVGNGFRRACDQDEAYVQLMKVMDESYGLAVYDAPPPWAAMLFIKRSELELHRRFFGAYWDWTDEAARQSAISLRKDAYRRALKRGEQEVERVLGKWLIPLSRAWPAVKEELGITGMQAIYFVEEAVQELELTLYIEDDSCGLWIPCVRDEVQTRLSNLGCSNFAHAFANSEPIFTERVDELRLREEDFDALIGHMRSIAQDTTYRSRTVRAAPSRQGFLDSSHPNYSVKLAAAVAAWEAVTQHRELQSGASPKAAIKNWLTENAARLGLVKRDGKPNNLGIDEVAKVANWKPDGGAPETPSRSESNSPTSKRGTRPL